MRKEVFETGKTLEEAINTACEKLGISRYDSELEIEVIDRPKKSFLGFKNVPAKVRISVEVPDEKPVKAAAEKPPQYRPAPAPQPEKKIPEKKGVEQKSAEKLPEKKPAEKKVIEKPIIEKPAAEKAQGEKPAEKNRERKHTPPNEREKAQLLTENQINDKEKLAREYLKDILSACGLEASYKVSREENGSFIDIEGPGLGLIIGRRGETLDALQYLAGLVANRGEGDYLRLTVDCGEYRIKRKDTLESLAKRLAQQVLKTNVSKVLEPMNPFERRIIHATVSEIEGVSSSSIGEEPSRRVVITTPTAKPGRPGRDGDGGYRGRPPRRENGDRPPRRESAQRPERGERQDRRGGRDKVAGRPPRKPSAPAPQGPPKQTMESERMSSIKFGKIDLE